MPRRRLVTLKDILEDKALINIESLDPAAYIGVELAKGLKAGKKSTYIDKVEEWLIRGWQSPKSLFDFLKFIGLTIPYKHNCNEKSHCSPFKCVSDLVLRKELNAVVWANRTGGKSYDAGLIQWLHANHYPYFDGKILGGSADQAQKSYQAMQDFWDRVPGLDKRVLIDGEQHNTFAKWKSRSIVSILTASQKSVRGPHPNTLILDEADVMDPSILEAALSQPMTKYNIPASIIILSTYHVTGGIMARLLGDVETADDDEKKKLGITNKQFKVYNWCVWEILSHCRDYLCSTCPLAAFCPGKHMKNAVGYYKVEDFIAKLNTLSMDTLETEWFCKKPTKRGSVYKEFDENLHVIDYPYNPNLPVEIAIDPGFSSSYYAVEVFQEVFDYTYNGVKVNGYVIVDEIYVLGKTTNEVIEIAKSKPWGRYPHKVKGICDSARPDTIKEWNRAGFKIRPTMKKETTIQEGINLVKSMLRPVRGDPKLFIHYRCLGVRGEMNGKYRYPKGVDEGTIKKGDALPIDKDNDACDAVRYYITWKNTKRSIKQAIVV